MKPSSELRAGDVIRHSGKLFRVLDSDYHHGGGKMPGNVQAKLLDLKTSHHTEQHFRPDERVEDVELEKRSLEFLYEDSTGLTFMDPESYEQITLQKEMLGEFHRYLQPNQVLRGEYMEGELLDVITPPNVTLEVTTAPEPIHGQHESNVYKTVSLENGMEILAPQFIKAGDKVEVEVQTGKYHSRVK